MRMPTKIKSMLGRRALLSLSLLALSALWCCDAGAAAAATSLADARPFLGRWDVTLKTPDRAYASWLEISWENGRLEVRMVGRWGHARALPQAEVAAGRIRFLSPNEEEGRADCDMFFEAQRVGADLVGETSGPDGTVWSWRGVRAPALKAKQAIRWG